jgi:hypothetical protein
VAREPGLHAAMLAHKVDELAALLLVRVVQPAAAVHHVVLLEHAEARTVGRRVGEYEHSPPVLGGVVNEEVLEPPDLLCVLQVGCRVSRLFRTRARGADAQTGGDAPSSMVTSCEVYLADLKTVEPSPTSSVLSAILRTNCGWGLLCSLHHTTGVLTKKTALRSGRPLQ